MKADILSCIKCKNTFKFSGEEKEYFKSKELNPPKRCQKCRKNNNNNNNNNNKKKPSWETECLDCGEYYQVDFEPRTDTRCKICHIEFIKGFLRRNAFRYSPNAKPYTIDDLQL